MNTDEIIRMAKAAGMAGMLTDVVTTFDELSRFASLVAAAEREACAKVCEKIDEEYEGEDVLATWCASAIRARGNE